MSSLVDCLLFVNLNLASQVFDNYGELRSVLVILFFVLFIGQLSTQFYKCCFVFPKWQIIFHMD